MIALLKLYSWLQASRFLVRFASSICLNLVVVFDMNPRGLQECIIKRFDA